MATSEPTEKENTGNDLGTKVVAHVLTNLLSPVTATVVAMCMIYVRYARGSESGTLWLFSSAAALTLSLMTTFLFLKLGLISNFDVTDRAQRPRLLLVLSIYILGLVALSYVLCQWHAFLFLVFLLLSFAIGTGISLFWKVSFHTFTVTLCVLMAIYQYPHLLMLLLCTLPFLTAWSRVVLKKHTFSQTMGGILLASVCMLLVFLVIPTLSDSMTISHCLRLS